MKIILLVTSPFRQVLEELVTEGSGEVLTCLASKLRGEKVEEVVEKKEVRHVVGEEGEEYRLEPTGKLVVPKLKHSESAPNILVHETMPKSILRPPGSPRNGQIKRARTTSIPTEVSLCLVKLYFSAMRNPSIITRNVLPHQSWLYQVWEIENCLLERDEEEWRQLEEESCIGR